MRIEERLRDMLDEAAAAVPDRDGDLAATMQRGDRRRRGRRVSSALVAAAAVGLLLLALAGLADVFDARELFIEPGPGPAPPPTGPSEGIAEMETEHGLLAAELVLSEREVPAWLGMTAYLVNQGETNFGVRDGFNLERWEGQGWAHVHETPGAMTPGAFVGERSTPFGIGYAGRQPLEPGWYAVRMQVGWEGAWLDVRARFRVIDDAELAARPDRDVGPIIVATAGSMPEEPGRWFADIVTDPGDLGTVWRRFQLEGDPPDVDLEIFALLFVASSTSCPKVFHDLDASADRVVVRLAQIAGREYVPPGQWPSRPVACIGSRRTSVIAVERGLLPGGGFVLEAATGHHPPAQIVLAGSPLETPPESPTYLEAARIRDVDQSYLDAIELMAEPRRVSRGEPVEIVLRNSSEHGVRRISGDIIDRWDRQRWRPAGEAHVDEARGGRRIVERLADRADPAQTVTVLRVDTARLVPGWYAIRWEISGADMIHYRRADFQVR